MEKTNSSYGGLAAAVFACVVLVWFLIIGSEWLNDTGDVMNRYDWAHGYGTSVKVGREHCEKWVQKHWKDRPSQYKYHCQWLYHWDYYDQECSYKDFCRWYTYAYNNRGRLKNPNNSLSCSAWLKKHKK